MTNELTEVEERLIRALAARAEQVTPHTLRPAAPPTGNWAARGRAPLVLALAASVASVALVGTAAVSLLDQPEKAPVAGTPSPVPEPPAPSAPGPSAPAASGGPVEPSAPGTSPSGIPAVPDPAASTSTDPGAGAGSVPVPPEQSSQAQAREVTVSFQGSDQTRTLRPGGATLTFTVTVLNTNGHTIENATDDLSITADGVSLGAADLNVSLLGEDGTWRPIAPTARLTTGTLGEGESRSHKVRVSLREGFPTTVDRIQVTAFSNAGQESVTPTP